MKETSEDSFVGPVPSLREEPLPECLPHLASEDPEAAARQQRLLASPTYLQADHDPQFLARDDMRHARLQLEYLKTELILQQHGIESTIVLFGSTRIVDPAAAQRSVEHAKCCLQQDPKNAELNRRVKMSERILAKSKYYDVAREFARLVSERNRSNGAQREFVITTGGGPGIMEAGNRGAYDAGCHTIGLNILLPMEQFPNSYISPDLCFRFHYFALRKLHFMKRAKALVAFPGGYGTLDEIFDALCLVQTRKINPIPIILVGKDFWSRAIDVDFLVEEGVIAPEDTKIFQHAEDAAGIWEIIRRWYSLT